MFLRGLKEVSKEKATSIPFTTERQALVIIQSTLKTALRGTGLLLIFFS